MKKFILMVAICCISTTAMFAQSKKDEASIRKVMADQAAAWNRGDLEGFMQGYWRSDEMRFISGDKITRGWQATLDNYKRSYGGPGMMGTLEFSGLEITFLSKSSAYVVGSWKLTREKDAPQGKFSLLWKKMKDGWRVVSDHSS
jgi:ketosteroid isomerase-like protein